MSKKEKEQIFESFIQKHKQRFSEIEKSTGIESNKLSYHLDSMAKEDMIVKDEEYYFLSKKAEKMMPFFAYITGQEVGNLCVVLCAIVKEDKIFLMKRKKRPYQGYWGLIGGKIKLEDSIEEAALREVKEETNIDCEFVKLNSVLHERVLEGGEYKHAFVLFMCTLKPKNDEEKSFDTEEGLVKWFKIDELDKVKKKIIPSDYYMIKELLGSKVNIKEVVIEDKDNKLINMDIKNI